MAVVVSKNGLIIMADGDTHTPEASAQIMAIIVNDTVPGTGTLTNGSSDTIFTHVGDVAKTYWYGISGTINTGGGLEWTGTGLTAYIYLK